MDACFPFFALIFSCSVQMHFIPVSKRIYTFIFRFLHILFTNTNFKGEFLQSCIKMRIYMLISTALWNTISQSSKLTFFNWFTVVKTQCFDYNTNLQAKDLYSVNNIA